MDKFFKNHWELTLGLAGLCLAAVLAGLFVWCLASVLNDMNKVFGVPSRQAAGVKFNLNQAQGLDYKGLQ